jgi:hypothetical protein
MSDTPKPREWCPGSCPYCRAERERIEAKKKEKKDNG